MTRRRSETRRPIIVSFSGIDGAGKSTQIDILLAHLQQNGARVLSLTFWNDVASLTQIREKTGQILFKGDPGVGSPAKPVNRRDKNVQSWYMTAVRFLLYFLDAISLRAVVQQSLKADVDVIVFDRYLYDELANLGLRSIITRAYARLLLRLVPQPEISFWLDVDPAHARARKPEYPLDFICSNRRAYLALSQLAGGWTIIAPQSIHKPIHQSIHDVGSHVLRQVLKKLSLDKAIRPADCAADGQLDAPATL